MRQKLATTCIKIAYTIYFAGCNSKNGFTRVHACFSLTHRKQRPFITSLWQSVEIASHIHKLRERLESCSFAKQNTYCINQFIYYKKWVNRPLNLILSESSQFFCANRPVRFFARIVPVESSQGGTGFCAKRPVTGVFHA